MSDKKKSFILHNDTLGILNKIDDEQAGKLFKAILLYNISGEISCDNQTELLLFPFQSQFDRDIESYNKIVERNKTNGSKGGRPKTQINPDKPSGLNGLNGKPKKADKDKDKGNDNDNEVIQQSFDHWWGLYPTTRRKNKKGCFTKWKAKCKKLSGEQIIELTNIVATDVEKRILDVSDVQFMPATESYLNQERWRDGE